MKSSSEVALVAAFSAVIVGSDLALSGPEFSNVKLLDTLVFVSDYLFGFRVGAVIGLVSESIWSIISPVGMAGAIAPFLIAGEVLFAAAGWWAGRVWRNTADVRMQRPLFIGSVLAACAFLWDFETNAATALLGFGLGIQLPEFLATVFGPQTLLFDLAHVGSDFAFGTVLAPSMIFIIPRASRWRWP